MDYILLASACLLFSLQFIFSKWYQLQTDNSLKAALWMTVIDAAWLSVLFFAAGGFSLQITAVSALYAILYSLFIMVCSVAALFAMRSGKVAVISLFMMTGGLVLPAAYGVLLLGEALTFRKAIGTLLILLSFFPGTLFNKGRPSSKDQAEGGRGLYWLLCLTVFICNGMVGVLTKSHSISRHAAPERDFLIFAALLRLTVGLPVIGVLTLRTKSRLHSDLYPAAAEKLKSMRYAVSLVLIVGGYTLCNGVANICSMKAAKTMDSSLQFPLISAAVLMLTALISWVLFKERPTKGEAAGICLTLGGMVFMIFR